jgi:hypothetical protein
MEASENFGDSLKKFIVPGSQRWELLRLLAAEGIRHHVLMPSYDSITKKHPNTFEYRGFSTNKTACIRFGTPGARAE